MTTPTFLLTVILFCSVLLTSHADHDDILTEEDVRAFEEAVAERRPEGGPFSILMGEAKVLEKRQSSRVRKVNAARGPLQQSNRKRGRQRSLLRRSGSEPLLTSNRRRVLRKRKRRPSAGRGGDDRQRLTQTRILGKSEPLLTERPHEEEEKDIEKAVLQALQDATTVSPTTREMSPLRMTPPRRGDSFVRSSTPSTTTTTEEASPAPLDDLIAALEEIQAPEILEAPTTTEETTTLTTTTETTTIEVTTTEPKTTIETILLVRSTSEALEEPTTPNPGRFRPTEVPSTDLEAQKLSDEIEKNFIEPSVLQPPEAEEPREPPSPPPSRGEPSPPGEQPPNDLVVSELNTAEDFLAVARRLQLFRRRQQL